MDKNKRWLIGGVCLFLAFVCLIGANVWGGYFWVVLGFLLLFGGAGCVQWARMDD